jgi:hypothetical protein
MTLGFNGFTEQLPTPDSPTPHPHSIFPPWAIALLVLVGLGALTVIGWFLYKRYKQKRLREQFLMTHD